MDPGSYLAIVDMTAKVVTLAFKTKQLWDEIKDVPADVSDLLRELQLTGRLFDALRLQLERVSRSDMIWDDRIMLDCLDSASTAQASLDALVLDLQAQLNSGRKGRRHLIAAKIVMKKDILQKLKDRLYGSTRLLQLAYQVISMQLIPEITAARVTTSIAIRHVSTPASSASLSDPSTAEDATSSNDDGSPVKNAVAKHQVSLTHLRAVKRMPLSYHGRVALAFGREEGACSLYLQMPRWWSYAVWEFASTRTSLGGSFQYRCYNIRPETSEIFTRASLGDTRRVQQMLDNGEASSLDVAPYGNSILHFALKFGRLDTCALLINHYGMGSFLEEQDYSFEKYWGMALLTALVLEPNDPEQGEDLSYSRFSWRGRELLSAEYISSLSSLVPLHRFRKSNQLVQTAIDLLEVGVKYFQHCHTVLDLDFGGLDIRTRCYAFELSIWTVPEPAVAWQLFKGNSSLPLREIVQSSNDEAKGELLHAAALAIGYRGFFYDRQGDYTTEWRDFGSQLIAACGTDTVYRCPWHELWPPSSSGPHWSLQSWQGTPLATLLASAWLKVAQFLTKCPLENIIDAAFPQWLSALSAAQVDLERYGASEASYFDTLKGAFDAEALGQLGDDAGDPLRFYGRRHADLLDANIRPIRIIGLEYGPEVEDWRLFFAPEYEWMASEFWAMVERPKAMPGTWID